MVNWKKVVPEAVEQAQGYFNEFNEAPTLRAIYYRLVSVEAIPNTRSAYKGLSSALSKARLNGDFPWHLMLDKTREKVGNTDSTTLDYVKHWLSTERNDSLTRLENAFDRIKEPSFSWKPGVWDGQENRVVIAIEKEAIMGAVRNVTSDYDLEIFPLRGYSSTTFIRVLAQRLSYFKQYGQVHLLIITDYDPSGEDIARDVEDRLMMDFGVMVHAKKILLTKEQILKYDLPAIPDDAEEMEKMARDPRFANWEEGFYRVELDAMAAIEPQAFREIINGAVEELFDREEYDRRQEEAEEACSEGEDEVRELYEEIEEVHRIVLEKIAELRES